jgi:hypothetical protein
MTDQNSLLIFDSEQRLHEQQAQSLSLTTGPFFFREDVNERLPGKNVTSLGE